MVDLASKSVFFNKKLIFLEIIEFYFSFWIEYRNRVKDVRQKRLDEHRELSLSTNAHKCLESFFKIG